MSLSQDLIDQARRLARNEPTKPKQASVRRSVSTSYYAVFHMLTEEAGRRFVGTKPDRSAHRALLGRTFDHRTMKDGAAGFANLRPPQWLARTGVPVPPEIRTIARNFVRLQELRHRADYDMAVPVSRADALGCVAAAAEAIDLWSRVKTAPAAHLLLVAILGKPRGA